MAEKVKLGTKVKDTVTGFEGIATGRAEYLHGAARVGVESATSGKLEQGWFEESRLVAVG